MSELNDEALPVDETVGHERRRPISESDGQGCRGPSTTKRLPHLRTEFATDTIGWAVRPLTREQAAADGGEAGS
ncbi:hypothetical protein [Natrinema altunense]|uniref:Uncharacterized protein n=1 Tax=Natrinema altunense TaxID=222984 RepID=A0A482Y464_9EURY|nr:hypothetical protein [Natrinema altunense]RZH68556.1 hypothetical protein ELS17_03560 [Natrinema altunense]